MPLKVHPRGNYLFLPGIAPYSCGVVSSPGFEIVHLTLQKPVAWRAGFQQIARILATDQRPPQALCSISLRIPAPLTFPGFAEFNAAYTAVLRDWDLFVDEINPVARTNVAPVVAPPTEPVLYAFAYTRPCPTDQPATFVVAGAGELPEGQLSRDAIVSLTDVSPAGIARKARFVMDLMEHRLNGLGASWSAVTTANLYTVHSVAPLLPEVILGRMGAAAIHGAVWHYSRPPIEEIEFEMDFCGTRTSRRLV